MKHWNSLVWATALLTSTQVSGHVIRVREQTLEARTVEVVGATATTLVQLAEELSLDLICLTLANPFVVFLQQGQKITVPLSCCGTSCQGALCSQRDQCKGQSTASKATGTATVVITTSVPATSTLSSTTTSSTPTSTTASSSSLYSTSIPTASSSSSSPAVTSTTPTSSNSATDSTTSTSSSSTTESTTSTSPSPSSSSSSDSTTSTSSSSSTISTTSTSSSVPASTSITPGNLPLAFVNNFAGGAINGYITGQDDQGKVVFIKKDGTFFRPTASGDITEDVAIPLGAQGSTTQLKTPGYITSGRIWFAQGTLKFSMDGAKLVQPSALTPNDASAGVNWGFIELTYDVAQGLYANLSFVDFLGLILGIGLQSTDGSSQIAKGLQSDSVSGICGLLKTQAAKDGQPWGNLCANDGSGNPIRVLSPGDYISLNNGAFSTYWQSYVNKVWQKYTSQPLNIDTQSAAGTVACKIQGDQLTCPGAARSYAKPNAKDIFGCNTGPFEKQAADNTVNLAVTARLCAAFDRSTLLLDGGDTQPGSTAYYTVDPTNYYSKYVHQYEVDGRGYAFAYDDVTPTGGEDKSGVLTNASPQLLTVYVGGAK